MTLHSPASLLKASGPIGRRTLHNPGAGATDAAILFADVAAGHTRDLYVENQSSTAAEILYVLLAYKGADWATATLADDKAGMSATTYIRALAVPAGSFKTLSFDSDCSVAIISASGTPAFLATICDK